MPCSDGAWPVSVRLWSLVLLVYYSLDLGSDLNWFIRIKHQWNVSFLLKWLAVFLFVSQKLHLHHIWNLVAKTQTSLTHITMKMTEAGSRSTGTSFPRAVSKYFKGLEFLDWGIIQWLISNLFNLYLAYSTENQWKDHSLTLKITVKISLSVLIRQRISLY